MLVLSPRAVQRLESHTPAWPMPKIFRLTKSKKFMSAVFEGEPGPDLLNPLGSIHGGWTLALIESATAAAVHSTLPAGASFATIETKGNFTRLIVPETGRIRAEGRVINAGRTLISAEARLTDNRGRMMAHGTSTVMVFRDIRD